MTTETNPPALVGDGDAVTNGRDEAARPLDCSHHEPEMLADEVKRLRAANVRLALELQIERSRRAHASDSGGLDWLRRVPKAWRELGGDAGLVVLDTVRSWYARLLPEREAAPAAGWALARWEIAALLAVTVVAALLRFVDLADTPPGVQGDEAAIAIEGRRVQEQGWIGPYSGIAAGMPTGVIYAVSVAQRLFGDSIHSVRIVAALFGTLTVPVVYFLARRSFGRAAALTGAGLLAATGWHIHYSRMGFPNIDWPFFLAAGLLLLVEAYRSGRRWWWVGSAVVLGLGVYTYSSHVVTLVLVAGYVGVALFGLPIILLGAALALVVASPGVISTFALAAAVIANLMGRGVRDRNRVVGFGAFVLVTVLVALPLIRYAADEQNNYFGYSERLSLTNSEEWEAKSGTGERLSWVAERYVDYWNRMCCNPDFDGVDATGTVPLVPLSMLLLAFAGMALALWRGQRLLAAVGTAIVLLVPLTSVMSVDFALRRTLVLTIFLAMFAGVAVVEGIRLGWGQRYGRFAILPLIALLSIVSVRQNLDDYFNGTVKSAEIRWVDAVEMVAASKYIGDLPAGSYVYFMTERWPFTHEIRRYYAPDAAGEDRSENFGGFSLPYDPANGRPVYILVGRYEVELERLRARYPGGEVVIGGAAEDPDFVAYLPPWPGTAAPAGTPVAAGN